MYDRNTAQQKRRVRRAARAGGQRQPRHHRVAVDPARVAVENHALDALARLAREYFDVCLLDIGMPGMDGLTLARRIRATVPAPQPALVAVTGFGEAPDRRAALDAGFDRFLVKPLTAGMLTAVLEELAPAHGARR